MFTLPKYVKQYNISKTNAIMKQNEIKEIIAKTKFQVFKETETDNEISIHHECYSQFRLHTDTKLLAYVLR